MFVLITILVLILAYLSGSVNYAIIITKILTGKDIRTLGNHVPGASNTGRSVGRGWGFLVAFLDGMKAMGPMILLRLFLYNQDSSLHFALLYLVGLAAILGHMKPVFYNFRGGGGIGCFQGILLFFTPVEYLAAMLIGGTIVLLFIKNVKHQLTQWTPIMFVTLTPFLLLGTNHLIDIPLFAHISIGGHPTVFVVCTFILSLFMLGMNYRFMQERKKEILSNPQP